MKLSELIEVLDKPLLIKLVAKKSGESNDECPFDYASLDSISAVAEIHDKPQYYEEFLKIVDRFKDLNVVSVQPCLTYTIDSSGSAFKESYTQMLEIKIDAPVNELVDSIRNLCGSGTILSKPNDNETEEE